MPFFNPAAGYGAPSRRALQMLPLPCVVQPTLVMVVTWARALREAPLRTGRRPFAYRKSLHHRPLIRHGPLGRATFPPWGKAVFHNIVSFLAFPPGGRL